MRPASAKIIATTVVPAFARQNISHIDIELIKRKTLMSAIFCKSLKAVFAAALVASLLAGGAQAAPLNGMSDYGTDEHGWYYTVTGGQFPTGPTPNGDSGSGGTFRFLVDNAEDWGRNPSESGVWQKDGWFADNAGIGLTLRNGAAIVYDNNGLEPDAATPADPTYYNVVTGNYPTGGHGAHVAYSMSNNFDWVYSGYFEIENETTVTELTGYFAKSNNPLDALTEGFDPDNPIFQYRMNIWSNVDGDLLPTDTDSFDGDVFASDAAPGAFAWSDTGFDRVGSSSTQDIFRLTYTLDSPLTLQPGTYWFSHDASIVPEPASIAIAGIAVMCVGLMARRRRS
jgi:PEP-CTERM motif